MRLLKKFYNQCNWKYVVVSTALFAVFLFFVLPYVSWWTEEVKHMMGSPDTMFSFNIKEYYELRMSYGTEGRRLYLILRWTFDIVWPLVYTFFYVTVIAVLAKEAKDKIGAKYLLVPLFAVLLDLLENIWASIFILAHQHEVNSIVYLLIFTSILKWIFVGGSGIVIVYLGLKAIYRKLTKAGTNRLQFRQFNNDDYDDLYDILRNPEVCKYLPGEGGKTKEETEKWLMHFIRSFKDEQGTRIFAITETGKEKVIGYGGLGYVKEFDKMEIMYGFHQSFWGQGYATETSLWAKHLASELGMTDLIALADINNIASQKVLLKTGFRQIEQIQIWGLDCYYYEMEL